MDKNEIDDNLITDDGDFSSSGGIIGPGGPPQTTLTKKTLHFLSVLRTEKEGLDPAKFPNAIKIMEQEISNLVTGNVTNAQCAEMLNDSPITLNVKCFPPTKVYPNFNYAGRIIGPKGTYLKAIMKETQCRMVLLGKGVMKDKLKEMELRESGDSKYGHLNEDMHVLITVTAPASEAYGRISYAIRCLKLQTLSDKSEMHNCPWIMRLLEGGGGSVVDESSGVVPYGEYYETPTHKPHHEIGYQPQRTMLLRGPRPIHEKPKETVRYFYHEEVGPSSGVVARAPPPTPRQPPSGDYYEYNHGYSEEVESGSYASSYSPQQQQHSYGPPVGRGANGRALRPSLYEYETVAQAPIPRKQPSSTSYYSPAHMGNPRGEGLKLRPASSFPPRHYPY